MKTFERPLVALLSFYCAGIVSIIVMSDPGSLSFESIFGVPLMAAVGLFAGPSTFAAGMHGMHYGYGGPVPMNAFVVSLCYLGYLALFAGACSKWREIRITCLVVEAFCALIAAKGVSFCI